LLLLMLTVRAPPFGQIIQVFLTSLPLALFEAKEVAGVRLLRLRNPWGGFGWKGDYSDNSSKWTAYLKEELNFEPQVLIHVFRQL
jgi:hypothetical protein